MTQAIIFTNDNGGVSVCIPTGELPINEVLAKDCPEGAIIVDDSIFPQGADSKFVDAWELVGTTVSLNFSKAQFIKLNQYNSQALQIAQQRQLNTLAGIENIPDDNTWLSSLTAGRSAIASATTTNELLAIANPT